MDLNGVRTRISNVVKRYSRLDIYNYIQHSALIASLITMLVCLICSKLGLINYVSITGMLFAYTLPLTVYVFLTAHKIESKLNEHTKNQTEHNGTINKQMKTLLDEILKNKKSLDIFTNLHNIYNEIPSEKGLTKFKEKYVHDVKNKLEELRRDQCIRLMKPEESFDLSIEMLANLQKYDEVMAVSFMGKGEWEEGNPIWKKYIDAQKKAANCEATIDRVFIVAKDKFRDFLNKDIVRMHTEGQSKIENINGYFIDKNYYTKHVSYLLSTWFDGGFVLINSNSTQEVMAVFDHFPPELDSSSKNPDYLDYRTTVIFERDKLNRMINDFNLLKSLSTQLTKENIKSSFNIDYDSGQQLVSRVFDH